MKPIKKVENVIQRKLRFTAAATLRDQWRTDVLDAQEQSQGIGTARHEPSFICKGRMIMRNPIFRLTSVAAVLAVAVLSLTFLGRFSSPAYAIDQTVDALQKVRFLHVVGRDEKGQIVDERWIEIGDNGLQTRYRQQNPPELVAKAPGAPSLVIEDGASTAVYRLDKKAVILYDRKDQQYQWIGELGKIFENLREKGKILKENDEYQGRPAHKVWWPALNAECYVDPETKLPFAIGNTQLSYEEPPAGTFEIVIPEGYAVLDKRPGAPASTAPDWLQQEAQAHVDKEESFRQGTRALLRGDYAEAAKQLEQAIGYDSWSWFWLGKAYYELGQYDLALKNYDTMFNLFSKMGGGGTVPFCQYARGLAYARLGLFDKAQADFQACLPAMIKTLRTPSGLNMFEYADSPLIRSGQSQPGEVEVVTKMINRLRLITGQNFGYDPSAADEQNKAALDAWEQWFNNGGQIKFTPAAPQLEVPAEWINRLGWGRKSGQEIAARYGPPWLRQVSDPGALMKIGFALNDAARYQEALAVFEKMETGAGDNQNRQATALLWQGHMLDLLGRRTEAIVRYKKVADMDLNAEKVHAQYGLSYKFSPYAQERLATPFTRVENANAD
jgi:tetratricopeptide (TPR) repeat protein